MRIFSSNASRTTELLAEAIQEHNKVIEKIVDRAFPEKESKSENDKRRAAYALNLCLVSISQIIDYNDLIVLEQEYDSILNNLNLEKMPKDEALLNILRQILDTVSYFRIQEVDKKSIELEFQQKMKNAIWSALPNVAVIMGSGNPAAIAINLATQIGTGYMNYRRTKAENILDNNKKKWEIQKTAMEQFHGLRRELFTTAWRLVEVYGIDEKYRLTEKQISAYNSALMVGNIYKRYEILMKLQEEYFQAYPQIYYQLAHTALEIVALEKENEIENEKYRSLAKKHFEKYFKFFKKVDNLLRKDEIYSTAAFEYAQLLDDEEKFDMLKEAKKNCDTNYDIMQLCAMSYIENNRIDEACELLMKLILNNYNEDANAQLLGMLYIRQYLNVVDNDKNAVEEKSKYKAQFENLSKYTNIGELIEFPEASTIEKKEEVEDNFLYQKRLSIVRLYRYFINVFYINKFSEYSRINDVNIEKERCLVEFLSEMQAELSEIEKATGLDFGDFSDKVKKGFKNWKDENGPFPKFDGVFKDFFDNAFNTLDIEYKSLDEISLIESCVLNFLKKYSEIHNDDVGKEYTLSAFFGDEEELAGAFKKIKTVFSDERKNEINKINSKKYELLVHGTKRYKDYIKNHKLNSKEIVAVLDGKKGKNDLLFTINGINVRISDWQKTGARIGAVSLGMLFGPRGIAVAAGGCEYLISVLSSSIKYKDVKITDEKMEKPDYSCDKNLMPTLKKLIEELKKIEVEESLKNIEKKLTDSEEKIKKIKDSTPKIKKEAKRIIEEFDKTKFTQNTHHEEHRLSLIKYSKDYLNNGDLKKYISEISKIVEDEPFSSIADAINAIIKLIK